MVDAIPQGSTPTGTKQISVTSNGTQTENVSGYANAQLNVSVPNTYSAGDEGKVVSNGALVAQTSDTVTQNDTYDTTLINSLTVNVSGGGSSLPRLLDHVEYILASDATSSNKQTINLTPVSSSRYVLFLTPRTMPPIPASGSYTALSALRYNIGATAYDGKGIILRSDGTLGTDQNMTSFTPSTGVLQIGGQYGTFRTGQIFDIYLFEMLSES